MSVVNDMSLTTLFRGQMGLLVHLCAQYFWRVAFFLFFHGRFGKEVCLTDQEYFQQDVKVLYNFVNKTVNVPALPGKAQIFPLADTFVPQDAIPCFLQNNPVCYCN